MKTVKKEWIIGIGGTEVDDVLVFRFVGTDTQVKRKLNKMVKEDRENDLESWDYGTESAKEVTENNGRYYAYGCYSNYHIDYSATPMDMLRTA